MIARLESSKRNMMIFTLIENRPKSITKTKMTELVAKVMGLSTTATTFIWYNIKLVKQDNLFRIKVDEYIQKLIDDEINHELSCNRIRSNVIDRVFALNRAIIDHFHRKKLSYNSLAGIIYDFLKKEFGESLEDVKPFNRKKDDHSRVLFISNLLRCRAKDYDNINNLAQLTEEQIKSIETFLGQRQGKNRRKQTIAHENLHCKECEALKEENIKLRDLNKALRLILNNNI